MNTKISIENIIELNERLGLQFGYELNGSSGMCGNDFSLEMAKDMSEVLTDIINGKRRKPSKFKKRPDFTGEF